MKFKFSKVIFAIFLTLLIALGFFDAFASLIWVSYNFASEANPLMAALMDIDYGLFLFVKLTITILCSILLWRVRDRVFAHWLLGIALLVYLYILYKHILIAYQVVHFYEAVDIITNG